MSTGTLDYMTSKATSKDAPKPPTSLIRVHKDVAEMLGDLAQLVKKDIAEIASPILRPAVQKRLKQVHEERAQKLAERRQESD